MEVPGTEWDEAGPADETIGTASPFEAVWREVGEVRHVFTHFELHLTVLSADAPKSWEPSTGRFYPVADLKSVGLPSVMMKAAKLGLQAKNRLL